MRTRKVRLGEAATIVRSGIAPSAIGPGSLYVGLEHVSGDGQLSPARITPGELRSQKFAFNSEHVLFGKLRPYLRKIARPHFEGICSTDILPILPGPDIDRGYLYHQLRSSAFVDAANNRTTGVNLPRLTPTALMDLPIFLPSLAEQRRVVALLDRVEGVRGLVRSSAMAAGELGQAVFESLFGNTASALGDTDTKSLEDLCVASDDIRCGPFGTQLTKSEFRTSGVPLWGIKQVNAGFRIQTKEFLDRATADRLRQYSILPGDVVMTRKGTIGNCAVYPQHLPPGIMHSDLLRLRVDRSVCDPEFLAHQLHHSPAVAAQVARISSGAIMAGVNVGKLKGLRVRSPDLGTQRRIAGILGRVRELISKFEGRAMVLDALENTLSARAFTAASGLSPRGHPQRAIEL